MSSTPPRGILMDLRTQLLSLFLLLTGSQVPPDSPDKNPSLLQGVWECSTRGDFIRLSLDADGTYVEWLLPDRLSGMVGRGFAGQWLFADKLLILMPNHKRLTPGDGVDREMALQELEDAGAYSAAEELVRTGQVWVALSDHDVISEGFEIRTMRRNTMVITQWGVSRADDEVKWSNVDIPCQRKALQIKPALPAKV